MDIWDFDKADELKKAKCQNHFFTPTAETVFISSDLREGFTQHLDRCKNLIALCELLDIQIAGLGYHGSIPVVFIDVRPSASKGSPKKFSAIYEFSDYFASEFDPELWTSPLGIETTERFDDWIIKI